MAWLLESSNCDLQIQLFFFFLYRLWHLKAVINYFISIFSKMC